MRQKIVQCVWVPGPWEWPWEWPLLPLSEEPDELAVLELDDALSEELFESEPEPASELEPEPEPPVPDDEDDEDESGFHGEPLLLSFL